MATLVQNTAELFADNASSIAPSLSGVTAGNHVDLLVACSQNGSATALTNPAGWSTAVASTGPGSGTFRQVVAHFYKENAASGSHSGTVTFTAGSFAAATICEFSGSKTSSSVEGTNSNSGNGVTGGSTNSASNTTPNALVIAIICASNDSGNMTGLSSPASSGYTNIDGELTDALHTGYQFSYKNVTSAASQSGSWTWTNASGFGAAITTIGDASAAPTIDVQPTDQTVNNGATATFTVTETGATSYQWKRNGSNVGTSSNSYTTPAVAYSDQGAQYTVDCINTNGTTTSSAATLRVAFNLSGTGPRSYPIPGGGPIAAGSAESYVRGTSSGGSSTITATASLGAAIEAAGTATASLSAAIQTSGQATASLGTVVQLANTATASLSAAVQAARAATASLGAAIQSSASATASADAAVQVARSASASLDSYILAGSVVTASLGTVVQAGLSASASLGAAVQTSGSATASLGAAVQTARTATASLGAAVQAAASATASLSAAVQAGQAATVGLNAYVQAGTSATASLGAAIQQAQSATASLSAAIASARTATASLGLAIATQNSAQASLTAAVSEARAAVASLGTYIFDAAAVTYTADSRQRIGSADEAVDAERIGKLTLGAGARIGADSEAVDRQADAMQTAPQQRIGGTIGKPRGRIGGSTL